MQDFGTLVGENIKLSSAGSIHDAGQITAWNIGPGLQLTPKMDVGLTSSMHPSALGQEATITATVNSIGGPPPEGENVTFTSEPAARRRGGDASVPSPF
jgi:hypothetical protein